MFSTFPTKPVPHSPRLRQSRHAHRSAIIYEPNLHKLPTRPQPAWTQPERPVPVIQLPGLPPRSVPKNIAKSGPKNWTDVSKKYVSMESFSFVNGANLFKIKAGWPSSFLLRKLKKLHLKYIRQGQRNSSTQKNTKR